MKTLQKTIIAFTGIIILAISTTANARHHRYEPKEKAEYKKEYYKHKTYKHRHHKHKAYKHRHHKHKVYKHKPVVYKHKHRKHHKRHRLAFITPILITPIIRNHVVHTRVISTTMVSTATYYEPGYYYADVVEVTPVIKMVRVSTPQTECWNEEVTHQADNASGMILGGIIGGAIGNRVGKGHSRKAAIAAGAIIGAAIGGNGKSKETPYTTIEERCNTVSTYHNEERVAGYDVSYSFDGNIYHTETDTHPGDRIKISISH